MSLDNNHNHTRYRPGRRGHYESFYLRANHPDRPLAFWIRYTLFSPRGRPEDAIGELWAVFFDGERNRHTAVKRELPLGDCEFATDAFQVRIGEAVLDSRHLTGAAESKGHTIAWELDYRGDETPLFMLPGILYRTRLAKAKSVVSLPLAAFRGRLTVDGETIEIDDWIGSQNHNWGEKHTDHYVFGQVAGFDGHPSSFLEAATARIKLGTFWTPFLTMIVLRHRGREYALNSLTQMLRAQADFEYFDWRFANEDAQVRIEGRIHAPRHAFVGLNYYNPPGGDKHCLNTKIAACELRLVDKGTGKTETMATRHRALLEMIPPETTGVHGVPIEV